MINESFKHLLATIRSYNPNADLALIENAFHFAQKIHQGQTRLSGDPYIVHPLAVAQALADWKLDSVSIVAGLLHDTVEEGNLKLEEIRDKFGDQVSFLVDGVTKIGEIKLRGSQDEEFVENLRKMIVVMARDLRVVLIKLADRYHNMQTLKPLSEEKQIRISRETLEIYAPLAERLGIGEMKGKLEDLALPYIYPQEYQWVKKLAEENFKLADKVVDKLKRKIHKTLALEGIRAKIFGRAKHLYSLYLKLARPEINGDISKIYDLMALRVVVGSIPDCYACLGIIHKLYKPFPAKGLSDFIAQPKPNGYRSIHTTVITPEGKEVEIQIRTFQMHEEAENGIAGHWYYSLQKNKSGISQSKVEQGFFAPTDKMAWVKELVKWQEEITDSNEFIEALKFDALRHRNFIFSPKGDVYDLPMQATPVDFAYAVHTDMGDHCAGAKVNGKLVSLDYPLKSGQVVEIIVNQNKKGPSRDWLDFVVTRIAKREIGKHFRRG